MPQKLSHPLPQDQIATAVVVVSAAFAAIDVVVVASESNNFAVVVGSCNDPNFVNTVSVRLPTHLIYIIIMMIRIIIISIILRIIIRITIISIVLRMIIRILLKIRKMLKIILVKVITRFLICLGAKHVKNKTKDVKLMDLGWKLIIDQFMKGAI